MKGKLLICVFVSALLHFLASATLCTWCEAAAPGNADPAWTDSGPALPQDQVVAKWVRRYSDTAVPHTDYPAAMAMDNSGNVYITGFTTGFFSNANSMATIVKYDKNGNQVWTEYWSMEQFYAVYYTSAGTAVAVDGAGSVYVAGYLGNTKTNEYSFVVLKYNAAGENQWYSGYKGTDKGFHSPTGIALDSEGSIYITGVVPGAGGTTSVDYMTVKLDATGQQQWAKRYNGPGNGQDYPTAIAVDQYNSKIYVTGYSKGSGGNSDYATLQYDPDGTLKWTRRFNGPGNGSDQANALVVDANGNVYVTGQSMSTGTKKYDYATVKYNISGTKKWAAYFNGPGSGYDVATAIGVDKQNNVYVTGYSLGSATGYDFATVKYDTNGTQKWVSMYNGSGKGDDLPTAMAVDKSDGSVYVTGKLAASTGDSDYVTIKYDTNGNQKWVDTYNHSGTSEDFATAVALDPTDGSVCVTGKSFSSTTGYDFGTIKYGKTGSKLWTKRFSTPNGENRPTAMKVDSTGNVYVTGVSASSKNLFDWMTMKYDTGGTRLWAKRGSGPGYLLDIPNALALDDDGNLYAAGTWAGFGTRNDYATAKIDPDGGYLWAKRYDGPAHNMDVATGVAVDKQKNVYVTGYSLGTANNLDFATIKYAPDGTPLWVKRYNGALNLDDTPTGIAVDGNGNVYVTGESHITSQISRYVTIKYDTSGNLKWESHYDGPGTSAQGRNFPKGIALDGSKNVYVTGASYNPTTTLTEYATVKYDTNGVRKWVKTYHDSGSGDDEPEALALDAAGNVYVTGTVESTKGIDSIPECATVKYSTGGIEKWVQHYSAAAKIGDWGVSIAVDGAGNAYVAAASDGGDTGDDYATIMYDANGVQKWVKRYNGPAGRSDYPTAVGVDAANNVYVTGASTGLGGFSEYATIKYSPE